MRRFRGSCRARVWGSIMILQQFKDEPDFPFNRYFESANQYTFATQYWLRVLRSVPNFVETDWKPRERPVEIEQNMYLGKVIDIISVVLKKEINLQTVSILGDANVLFRENGGLSDEEYKGQKKLFGENFELDDKLLNSITYEEALQEAQENSKKNDIMAWVEKAIHWQPDIKYPEGGYDINIERLILTAEISEYAEPKVLQAIELFLQEGSAIKRVNSIFSPDED